MGGRGDAASCSGEYWSRGFSDESLNEHYAKHGRTFGDISKEEYRKSAVQFRDSSPNVDVEEFTAQNESIYKYNTRTKEFMVHLDDGEIITYFKPDNPAVYWMKQRVNYEE
jgi:pyocin large subunit-like protein